VDRKTARRYVEAAVTAGLTRDGGTGQLTDELVGQVAEAVRPVRPGGHGQAWDRLEAGRLGLCRRAPWRPGWALPAARSSSRT
jgi:hypothetical protein